MDSTLVAFVFTMLLVVTKMVALAYFMREPIMELLGPGSAPSWQQPEDDGDDLSPDDEPTLPIPPIPGAERRWLCPEDVPARIPVRAPEERQGSLVG